jgi:hypothetical protein
MGGMRGGVLLLYNKGVKYTKSMPVGAILFTLILLSFKHHCTSEYLIYFTQKFEFLHTRLKIKLNQNMNEIK